MRITRIFALASFFAAILVFTACDTSRLTSPSPPDPFPWGEYDATIGEREARMILEFVGPKFPYIGSFDGHEVRQLDWRDGRWLVTITTNEGVYILALTSDAKCTADIVRPGLPNDAPLEPVTCELRRVR